LKEGSRTHPRKKEEGKSDGRSKKNRSLECFCGGSPRGGIFVIENRQNQRSLSDAGGEGGLLTRRLFNLVKKGKRKTSRGDALNRTKKKIFSGLGRLEMQTEGSEKKKRSPTERAQVPGRGAGSKDAKGSRY